MIDRVSQTDTQSGEGLRDRWLPDLDILQLMENCPTTQPSLEALLDWVEAGQ